MAHPGKPHLDRVPPYTVGEEDHREIEIAIPQADRSADPPSRSDPVVGFEMN